MPEPIKRGNLNLELSAQTGSPAVSSQSAQDQLRILVLGNFSGQADPAHSIKPDSKSFQVDYDNFDSVLARIGPTANLGPSEGGPTTIRFQSLEDFHPDKILSHFDSLPRL